MIKSFYVITFLILGSYVYEQQTGCKVKLPEISGSYSGKCKKGLADGEGIAQGIDRYEGHFVKGLPDGTGVYKWVNGSYYEGEWKKGMREGEGKMVYTNSVVTGFWKANQYLGKTPGSPYSIVAIRNVQRYTISKSVEPSNGVRIKLLLGGRDNSEVEDLSLAYTSGTEYRNVGVYGIENYSLPLEVTVRYITWNQLHTRQYDVLFEVTIFASGTWIIDIANM